MWETLGAFDEQSTEGVHPEYNHLNRRFGNSRGALKKDKIMREFLFSRSSWIVETIDEMLKATSRKKINSGETNTDGVVMVDEEAVESTGDEEDVEEDVNIFEEDLTSVP